MFFNVLNPGPNSPGNYQQPGASNPAPNPQVANFPVGQNPLQVNLAAEISYYQPGSTTAVTGAPPPVGVVPAFLGASTPTTGPWNLSD
jgi:hypothetical protein